MNPPGSRFCNYCGNDLHFSIQPDGILAAGSELRGTYVIENVIGEGGMGVVYRCHHKTLGTPYALKVLDPKLARMDILRQRFLAEAKIQATVLHPHIVHVHDVIDRDKDGGPGVLAIVMDYVEGEALDQKIETQPLSERDAVSSTLVILDAIGFAHHANIVHRDLKPSNIMVSAAEAKEALYRGIKVMDFGIAKLLQENKQRTVTGVHMGTLRYMAPEQIENARNVDERSDLYSIGMMLYELLCGRTPFEDFREFELIQAHLSMKPPSMRNYRSDISDRLEAIVMKALEKDRNNRYPNAESFQRALLSLGGYDDITLMLNPFEGVTTVQTNQKLQRKIERAIARSQEECADNKEKSRKTSAKKSHLFSGVQDVTPEVAKKREMTSTRDPQTNAKRLAETPENPRVKRNPSETQSPEVKTASGTPSRSFKHNKPNYTVSPSSKSLPAVPRVLEGDAPKTSSTPKNQTAVKTTKTSSTPKNQTAVKASKTSSTPKLQTAVKATKTSSTPKNQTAVKAPKTSSTPQNRVAIEKPTGVPRSRSTIALKIVLFVIFLLILAGLIYRHHRAMPTPVEPLPASATAPSSHEGEEDFERQDEDFSRMPLREIDTETGRMTAIPAARHWLSTGNGNELHQAELPAFAIDQVEVSHYQYAKCVEASKCPPLGHVPSDLNLPVTHIGYGSAEAFCKFAGKSLPTVEQWEAAARFGGDDNGITHVNVTCENFLFNTQKGGECARPTPSPESVFYRVQSGNPGHILNMLGNVREWTSTPDKKDPQKRQTKGGSYLSGRRDLNISAHQSVSANSGAEDVGFRCVQ